MPRRNPPPTRPARNRIILYTAIMLAVVASWPLALAHLAAPPAPADSGIEAQAEFVRQIPLPVNDVVYNPADHLLYVSVPSSAGGAGNTVAPVNPATGEIGTPVFVGSEPSKLAMADDGHTLYVTMDGSYTIRRFDTATRTPGAEFAVGQDSFHGVYSANDLAVAPGNPNVVAVVRYYLGTSPPEAGVAIFDNGVQRPKTGVGHISGSDYVAYSASESKLYGGGSYDGLRTMTIDATGVASTTISAQSAGTRIKFANGRIYGSGGQVFNPDTNTLLGTFAGVSTFAFTVDTAAERAYYVSRDFSSGSVTLRAFNINTFVTVGSVTLSGVTGDPLTLVRWGTNGLALRTSSNQLFVVQTSLIPSGDPVPTPTATPVPTATPSPTPVATFVRQIPLATNDLIYNTQNQLIYASVPSAAGANGNSVTRLNPETGEIGQSVFVGSEPGKLALSDDGQTMYVGLNGANSVRRLDVSAQTAGTQFYLGSNNLDGPYRPEDIAVMPGSPGTVAVSKNTGGSSFGVGTAIYDDGVQRSQTSTFGGPVEFGSPTRLYIGSNQVQRNSVSASGLAALDSFPTNSYGDTRFVNGLLYLTGGSVVDPETGMLKGRFLNSTGFGFGNQAMAIDAAKNRAYFLGDSVLRSYELDTFRPIASVTIQGIGNGTFDGPTSLIRWGKNGLAFRTTNRVFLIQTALVDASDPIPTATPTPSPTPSPTPVYVPTLVKKVDLAANDLVIDASTQILYASVPSTAGTLGNTITAVNPQTATVGQSAFVGSEPGLLAIAGDGQTLYVNLEGAKAVRRFDYLTMSPGLQFTVGVDRPFDMEVVPGSPQSLAVSRGTTFDNGVAVYDNGVKRPNSGTGNAYGIGPIEFGATPSVLYGYDSFSSGFELVKFQVDSAGVTALSTTNNLLSGYISSLEYSAGRLYSASGRVVDPEAKTLLGTFNAGGTEMLVDQTLGRVFFLSNGGFSGSNITLSAFDINTFLPLGSVTLGGVTGTPNGLVRWGANGLAFCTVKQQFDSSSTSQIYLVQSALVSNSVPIPSALQFGAANYSVFEGGGNNAVTVTVTRTGGVAGGTTVNYATGGGTATPGVDYTPASGTLTFADGETSKTFTVSVLDDNVFEGNETIGLTLTNPSGDASLGTLPTATLTIQDNESQPFVTTSNLFVPEGESGTKTVQLTVALSNATTKTVTFNYATANGTATAGSDYVATSGTLTFAPGETTKTIPVEIVGDAVEEPDEQFSVGFSNPTNVTLFGQTATITILADEKPFVQFAASTFNANEGSGRATITVTRFGPLTGAASVEYFTADDQRSIPCDPAGGSIIGLALARCDYATTYDTLTFAPGESSKTFTIPLIDDSYSESQERVQIVLFGAVGAALGSPSSAFLNINDNDSTSNQPNPLDANAFFVRQHYLDFLSREPDAEGLAAWTGVLDRCPNSRNTDPASPSAGCDQNIVSSSFFRSTEFQLKGYFVYRFYRVAFNRRPQYSEFIFDMRRVTGETADEVYTKRRAFSEAWVQRQEFTNFLGGLSNSLFVDTLLGRYGINAINTPDPATPDGDALVRLTRDGLVSALDAQPQRLTRAQVLRAIVQSREIDAAEYNGAFVAMQYYGYLRRAPEQSGYDAWLQVITRGDGYRVMVNGFMNSTEYRLRFGKP